MAWFASLLIVGVIVLIFIKSILGLIGSRGRTGPGACMVCTHCGSRGEPATKTRGHFLIELALWCCFIIPGLIYSMWRISSRQKVCPACGAQGMIPANSPLGKKIIQP